MLLTFMVKNIQRKVLKKMIDKKFKLAICALFAFISFGQNNDSKELPCNEDSLVLLCLNFNNIDSNLTVFQGREAVVSLQQRGELDKNRECLSDLFLSNDPIFTELWDTEDLFPDLFPIDKGDTIIFDILYQGENFYYNYWGEFNWAYGPRWGRMHRGLDLGLDMRDSLRSTFNGIVRYAKFNQGGYGNCVVIRHFNGIETLYAHLDEIKVVPGELVLAGDFIGFGGTTGRSTGPHLHFETRYKGRSFDPLFIFDKDSLNVKIDLLYLTRKDITDPPIPKKNAKYHKVRPGESLSVIARKYGTSVSRLQKLNGIKNANLIRAGQNIRVR